MPEEEAEEVVEIIRSQAEKPGDVVISSQVQVGVKEKDDEKEPLVGDHGAGSCVLSLSPPPFACGFGTECWGVRNVHGR